MYLYGQATKNPQLKTLGNALLLMEAHSTNYYWHVKASNGIYPPEYEHNIVGIVHEMLVEFQTFFGLRHAVGGRREGGSSGMECRFGPLFGLIPS